MHIYIHIINDLLIYKTEYKERERKGKEREKEKEIFRF